MKEFNSRLNAEGVQAADAWEKSLGFVSVAHIFQEVNNAEDALEKQVLAGKSTEELDHLKELPAPHTALYKKWVDTGTLRVTKEADGGERLGVNASHDMFTNVLNADGVVAFGDTVYQYKGRYIKRTMNGFSNLTALKAATQSDSTRDIVVNVVAFSDEQRIEKEKNHVQTSTTPLTVTSTSDLVVFNDFQDAITNYSVGGTSRRVILTASLYSELYDIPERANFYHFNNVDFWFQARAEYKNFWGNWKPQEGGKGISSLTANYSWTAAILLNADNSPSIYNNIYVTDYTSGSVPNFSYPYLATSKPGTIRFDKTTGTPTNGYQIAPNGVYGPQFFNRNGEIRNGYGDQLYLDSKFTISQGLKLNSGAVFTCTVDGSNVTTILNWNK